MDYLPPLFEAYSDATGLKPSTVGRLAGGKADVLSRAKTGRITGRRTKKIIGWFSDHWPADLLWPPDIPRPTPSPDSPAARATQAARDAAKAHPALQLSAKGQIRKPAALCDLLGIELDTYYQATSQYAAGKARADQTPRKGSDLSALVAALALAGDYRFAHHKAAAQISIAMPGGALSQRLAMVDALTQ